MSPIGTGTRRDRQRHGRDQATSTQIGQDRRAAAWRQLQASQYEDLRAVGEKLQRAWTTGGLADQLEANTNVAMACAVHGVEVPLG
jgi:hypothetical protein